MAAFYIRFSRFLSSAGTTNPRAHENVWSWYIGVHEIAKHVYYYFSQIVRDVYQRVQDGGSGVTGDGKAIGKAFFQEQLGRLASPTQLMNVLVDGCRGRQGGIYPTRSR